MGDLFLVSATKGDEERALVDLQSNFPIKDLGQISHHLGCRVSRDRKVETVTIDQRQHANEMIKSFKIVERSKTPVTTGAAALPKIDGPRNGDEANNMRNIPYREAVEALMWIATLTRLHLSFAAHNFTKSSNNQEPAHWEEVMNIMQYMKRTTNCWIMYGGTSRNDAKLSAWVDANHAACPDTRLSVSAAASMLAGDRCKA